MRYIVILLTVVTFGGSLLMLDSSGVRGQGRRVKKSAAGKQPGKGLKEKWRRIRGVSAVVLTGSVNSVPLPSAIVVKDDDGKLEEITADLEPEIGFTRIAAYLKVYDNQDDANDAPAWPDMGALEAPSNMGITYKWTEVKVTTDPILGGGPNNWIVFWGIYQKDGSSDRKLIHRRLYSFEAELSVGGLKSK